MIFLISTIIVFFLDIIFLPSFLGFKFSSLLSLLLISIILYFGVNKKSIWVGILISAIIEIILKYIPGSYVTSFVILVLFIFLALRFLNFPSLKYSGISTILVVSTFAPFINYLFFLIFNIVSGYAKNDYGLILPFYSPINPLFLILYSLEMFLIILAFRFLDSIKYV